MKVTEVNPGIVKPYVDETGAHFQYTIEYVSPRGNTVLTSRDSYPTAPAAKQAMREKVAHERKRHGV